MSGERKVICLVGKGDCPENCPAYQANKGFAEKMLRMRGIDITTLPLLKLYKIRGDHLGVFSQTMLTAACIKNKTEGGDQAKATE